MKILVVSHLFPNENNPNYGIFMARQVEEMARQGMDITVIVPMVWAPPILTRFKRWKSYDHNVKISRFEGLKTVAAPYLRITGNWFYQWNGLFVYWALKKIARRLHQKEKYDIIYARSFFPDGDAIVRLGRYLKLPTVCVGIGRDINIIPHYSKAIYNRFVKTANALDGTIASGKAVADKIDAVSGKTTLSVYGVVNLEKFVPVPDKSAIRKELGLPVDKVIVLYLSSFKKDKGVYELLQAFLQISREHENAELRICGAGVEKQGMIDFIQKNDDRKSMHMMGSVEYNHVNRWMQACDLFILPTYHEGMPNAVMEAMACGLPVVASAVGGLPEAVGDSDGALLVPAQDVKALKDAMDKVVSDAPLRQKMAAAARQRAEERFGVGRTASTIIDYLKQIKAQHHNPKQDRL